MSEKNHDPKQNLSWRSGLLLFLLFFVVFTAAVTGWQFWSGQPNETERSADNLESQQADDRTADEATPTVQILPGPEDLELPVAGATGYTPIAVNLRRQGSASGDTSGRLEAGTAFQILAESDGWWHVKAAVGEGWLESQYCLINLPDVIPSIIYDNTNTYSSIFLSSQREIPNVTGEVLYEGRQYNERLGREEFIMLALYPMAKKIHQAQQQALADGNSLLIYEAYRPRHVQKLVLDNLNALAAADPVVKERISTSPWSISWFISTGTSNHQRGGAIDVSLAEIITAEEAVLDGYAYPHISAYKERFMPTEMHELSHSAVSMAYPVNSNSATAWQSVPAAKTMTDAAFDLQRYCTAAGLTPLASEWWHFNDLDVLKATSGQQGSGDLAPAQSLSVVPSAVSSP